MSPDANGLLVYRGAPLGKLGTMSGPLALLRMLREDAALLKRQCNSRTVGGTLPHLHWRGCDDRAPTNPGGEGKLCPEHSASFAVATGC